MKDVRLLVRIAVGSGHVYRAATLLDVQELLREQGLEIVRTSQVNWTQDYPRKTAHLMRIQDMTRQLIDLRRRLRARNRQGAP